jgi:hypothetical protein
MEDFISKTNHPQTITELILITFEIIKYNFNCNFGISIKKLINSSLLNIYEENFRFE